MKRPDALEKGIRFGCGGLLGLVMGLAILFKWWFAFDGDRGLILFIVLLGHVAICGWLATRYGDRYWERLKDWLWIWS